MAVARRSTRFRSTATGCGGAGQRSTAPTRSTTASRGCCTARSSARPKRSVPTGSAGSDVRAIAAADSLAVDIMRPMVHIPAPAAARRPADADPGVGGGVTAPRRLERSTPASPRLPTAVEPRLVGGRCGIIAAGHRHGWAVAEGGTGDQRRDGSGATRTRRADRHRRHGVVADRSTAVGRGDVRSRPRRDRPDHRRPHAKALRPRLPALRARPRRVQARPGDRRPGAVAQPRVRPGWHGTPRWRARRDRRCRTGSGQGHDARAAVRTGRPAVRRRPDTLGRQPPPAVGVRPRAARLHRRRHRGDPRADRALRSGLARADRGDGRTQHDRDGDLQRELCRRRRGHGATRCGSCSRPRQPSIRSDRCAGHVHLLSGEPAGAGARRLRFGAANSALRHLRRTARTDSTRHGARHGARTVPSHRQASSATSTSSRPSANGRPRASSAWRTRYCTVLRWRNS